MKFRGFGSISAYEAEARRVGFVTERIPCQKDGEQFFVLVTSLACPSPTSVSSWNLFSEDESQMLLDGVINGYDSNFIGKLTEHGFSVVE